MSLQIIDGTAAEPDQKLTVRLAAATGAAIGAIVGGGKGAGQGAAIGAVVGLLGGGVVGHYLDNQAKEMQAVMGEQDRLRREQESLTATMASDVLFSSGSAQLYPGGREKLRNFAGVLTRYPRTTIQIVGNTDSRGSEESNMELSRKRAQAVADELVAAGVDAGRLTTRGVFVDTPIYDGGGQRPYWDKVYLTGARFMEDLRGRVGDEIFFAFLKDYYTRLKANAPPQLISSACCVNIAMPIFQI